jgi:hypothetical protein
VQLDELRTKITWYEGRIQELEAAQQQLQPQQLRTAFPSSGSAASPSDTASPCALQPPHIRKDGSRPDNAAVSSSHSTPQHRKSHSCDAQVPASPDPCHPTPRETDAHACADELEAQRALNDLLAPSDSEATPRAVASTDQSPRRDVHAQPSRGDCCELEASDSPARNCGNSCSTLSFEDGENIPDNNGAVRHQSDVHAARFCPSGLLGQRKKPLSASAQATNGAVQVRDAKLPNGPFSVDLHSPGSMPLGKSARAKIARERPSGAATSFGRGPTVGHAARTVVSATTGSDRQADRRAANCSAPSHRDTCDGASIPCTAAKTDEQPSRATTQHVPSCENFAPVSFGVKRSLNSPPTLRQDGDLRDDTAREACESETDANSAPREPLSSVTQHNADVLQSSAVVLPQMATSGGQYTQTPFPAAVDVSAGCSEQQHRSHGAHCSALVRKMPSYVPGIHARMAGEFQVSASVQVCTHLFHMVADEIRCNHDLLCNCFTRPEICPQDAGRYDHSYH